MILLEAAALAAFLALSAYFALVEAAVTALSAVRMKKLAFIDPVLLPHFQEWLEKPHRLLTVLMIGNNLVNVAFSSLAALAVIPLHRVFPSVVVHETISISMVKSWPSKLASMTVLETNRFIGLPAISSLNSSEYE